MFDYLMKGNNSSQKLLLTSLTLVLVLGLSTTQAFALTGSGDDVVAESVLVSSQVVVEDVDCNIHSNVVAWITNNGNTLANYQSIGDDIQNNLGVTAKNVAITNSVPSCIEKLVISHAPGACNPAGIGAAAEAAVLDWVNNQGGELLILEEFVGCGGGSAALTAAFGATWNGNSVITIGFPGEAYTGAALNAAHPIMAGVTTMNMQAGSDFTSDGTLTTIVTDPTNDLPVLLAGPVNDGCVVISGDSNWMSELSGAIDIADSRVAANNVFNFMNNICNQVKVGGEFLPIDSTALLVAGAQTNAVWILSALAVIGSIAFGALYITSKKN